MEINKIIEYKGKSLKTKHYKEITEEERQQLEKDYFTLPDYSDVTKQFETINKGGVKMDKITNYYFKELMSIVQCSCAKWTVKDVFENKELLGVFVAKALTNDKVFPPTEPLWKNVCTAMRLGGKGYAKLPTQFPIKTVDLILNKYNKNNNYLDYSCGWGARLVGALKHNINYYGIDPNYELVKKLNLLANNYKEVIVTNKSLINIKNQGSEIYIPEWENLIGLAFSSPPYFNLEDYKIGNQSYTEGKTFDSWVSDYLKPTISNIYKYLISGGYFCINIKNFNNNDLIGNTQRIAEKNNFIYIGTETLKNTKRVLYNGELHNGDEIILIYQKP